MDLGITFNHSNQLVLGDIEKNMVWLLYTKNSAILSL